MPNSDSLQSEQHCTDKLSASVVVSPCAVDPLHEHVELHHIVVNASSLTCVKGHLHSFYCCSLIYFMTLANICVFNFLTQDFMVFVSSHFVSVCVN